MKKYDENSQFIEDWKKIARQDWRRGKRNLRDQDAIVAGFYLQQCIEKSLKAYLILHGWELKKIHRLDTLLDYAVKYDENLNKFYDLCERIPGYYRADRCPPLGVIEVTAEDIEKDLEKIKEFIQTMFPEEDLNG